MTTFSPKTVLDFWFAPEHEELLFVKNDAFDEKIRSKFYPVWVAASQGLLVGWRSTVYGRLAEIIVLDQFSRNLMRGTKEAFAQDAMALVLAQELIQHPEFKDLTPVQKQFALLPLEHSESPGIHEMALPLFEAHTSAEAVHYEILHKRIIDRFGRYPHRNEILGRESSLEELEFLKEEDSSF